MGQVGPLIGGGGEVESVRKSLTLLFTIPGPLPLPLPTLLTQSAHCGFNFLLCQDDLDYLA